MQDKKIKLSKGNNNNNANSEKHEKVSKNGL